MHTISIPDDAETLISYLFANTMSSSRTLDTLYRVCPREMHVQETLLWLIDNQYACQEGDAFELTAEGMQTAQQIQMRTQSASLSFRSISQNDIPTADLHPLRTHTRPLRKQSTEVNYLLAFENPNDALPIPVLDGDMVGRLPDVSINLTHDTFISGHHCRFTVRTVDNQLALCVEDLDSRNGTFVDGQRLKSGQIVSLEHGSRIEIGHTLLIVVKIPY